MSRPPGAASLSMPAGPAARALPEFVTLGAIWGASFLFMKIGAAEFGALPTAALRVGIAALFLLPLVVWRGLAPLLLVHWRVLLAIGLLNSGLPFALFSFALLTIPTGLSAIINATVPMFGALVAWLWFGDRLTRTQLLGLVLGFAGVSLLTLARGGGGGSGSGSAGSHHGAAELLAMLACTLACVSYGIAANATRRYLAGVPALVSAAGSQLGATLALALPALWLWPKTAPTAAAWGALAAVGVICTGVAYILFFRLIDRAGPTRTLTVTYLVPLFALGYGVAFLDEKLSWPMLGCGVVIGLGTALSSGRLRRGGARSG